MSYEEDARYGYTGETRWHGCFYCGYSWGDQSRHEYKFKDKTMCTKCQRKPKIVLAWIKLKHDVTEAIKKNKQKIKDKIRKYKRDKVFSKMTEEEIKEFKEKERKELCKRLSDSISKSIKKKQEEDKNDQSMA